MILTTKFLRNKTQRANEFKIHPYIQQYTNNACFDDQIFEVTFPDVNPRDLPKEAIFAENHGEFLATYKPQKGAYWMLVKLWSKSSLIHECRKLGRCLHVLFYRHGS
jgi:Ni2+-binding GTPase involved in maturation of urease and hydrogenase